MHASRLQNLRICTKYILKQFFLQCNPQNTLHRMCRVTLHTFCELLAFWSTEAQGQRFCHDFLIAELRMAVSSMALGAWISGKLSITANDHY